MTVFVAATVNGGAAVQINMDHVRAIRASPEGGSLITFQTGNTLAVKERADALAGEANKVSHARTIAQAPPEAMWAPLAWLRDNEALIRQRLAY